MIAPAQGDEVAAKLVQGLPVELAVLIELGLGGPEVMRCEQEGNLFREIAGDGVEAHKVPVETGDRAHGFVLEKPFAITAFAPLREVLCADGFAVEFGIEDRANHWVRIEPLQNRASLLALEEASIQHIANRKRESGDLASAGHIYFRSD